MEDTIEAVEEWVGQRLPGPYRSWLAGIEVELTASDRVLLYGLSVFVEMNEANEVKVYSPGHVTIGNDSGGRELLLSLETGAVSLVDAGSMDPAMATPVAGDFQAWLSSGCPLPDSPETPHPDRIDLYLLRPPAEGLKGLVRVLKRLDRIEPVSRYREILASTPCRIARDVPYLPYSWRSAELNLEDPCLGVTEVDQPDRPVRIEPRRPAPGAGRET